MSRRESRELVLQFLFQMEFHHDDASLHKQQFLENSHIKENETQYFYELVDGIVAKKNELDSLFSSYLKNWNLDRISRVDQTILRIATYEILYVPSVPFNVTVSEAVILARKFSTNESRAYINGVLGNMHSFKKQESEKSE
jgi:transcription antitermination protein NusB